MEGYSLARSGLLSSDVAELAIFISVLVLAAGDCYLLLFSCIGTVIGRAAIALGSH